VFESTDVAKASSGTTADRSHREQRGSIARCRLAAGLALAAGLLLGACAIPFGDGAESTDRSSAETRRERNQRYLEEQDRMEQQRLRDRWGPSDR
jgi:hypothetical protein